MGTTAAKRAHRHIVSVELAEQDVERLRELARASERSLSGELRIAVGEHLRVARSEEST